MSKVENQLSRMKSMMTYGLQTENKSNQYSTVEYQKLGADGKTYGIVREGTKFYIKVADSKKPNLVKESFDYIGGFRNRKSNEYTSYANALKHFDMKMISLKESTGNKTMMVESWNPERNEYLMVEATETMRKEIARQKQIMGNAAIIMEKKNGSCSCEGCGCATEEKGIQVLPKGKGGDIFTEKPCGEDMNGGFNSEKNNIGKAQAPKKGKKATNEAAEPLAWHKTGGNAQETMADTYLDTSHGTEIGDSAPFTKGKNDSSELDNGTVEEGTAMHTSQNQNSPSVGVGEIGDDDPFTEKVVNEAEEGEEVMDDAEGEDFGDEGADFEDDAEFGGEDFDGEGEDFGDEDFDGEGADFEDDAELDDEGFGEDEDLDMEDDELEDEGDELSDLRDEIASLKDMLSLVLDKVGADNEDVANIEFEDDDLYDEGGDEVEEDFDTEEDFGGDFEDDAEFEDEPEFGNEEGGEFDDEDEFDEIHESRSYRRMKSLKEGRRQDAWKKQFDELFGGNPFDEEGCKELGLDAEELYSGKKSRGSKARKSPKVESTSRRNRRVNEDRLDYFGKHPAYRKEPMKRPVTGQDRNEHGRDWNDDSVHSENPYGEKIGSGAPFNISPADIENSIAESIKKVLGRRRKNF